MRADVTMLNVPFVPFRLGTSVMSTTLLWTVAAFSQSSPTATLTVIQASARVKRGTAHSGSDA